MQNYAYARGGLAPRGPRREGPADEGFVSLSHFHHLPTTHPFCLPQLPPIPTHGERMPTVNHNHPTPSATPHTPDRGRPTFGVDLSEQMARDNVELPAVMEKCCQAIEKYGLRSQGIYRINGTARKVTLLKEKLDKGLLLSTIAYVTMLIGSIDLDAVDLDSDEWSSDINNVTSALKSWFRELPDPVLTLALHQGFIDAASEWLLLLLTTGD